MEWQPHNSHRAARGRAPSDASGRVTGGGEVELAPGESYTTPECLLCFSDDGMTGLAQQWHSYVRKTYETSASDQVRPVQLNTWEACYFDVNEATVLELIDEAADLGIERFVWTTAGSAIEITIERRLGTGR